MTWFEEECRRILDLAEKKLGEDRGKKWSDLADEDKGAWSFLLMDLSDFLDCLGDDLTDITKKRIAYISENYPKADRTERFIINDLAVQALDDMRDMSEEEYKQYLEKDEENEESEDYSEMYS